MNVQPGSTDVTTYFVMRLSADGTTATGLTPADFDLQYVKTGAAPVEKVDAHVNANGIGGDHDPNSVIEVDATDQPGLYRVDWVDAAFSGVPGDEVILTAKIATAFTEHLRVELSPPIDVQAVDGSSSDAEQLQLLMENGVAGNRILADLTLIHGTALSETSGQLAAGFVKLFDVATPLLVASTVMRGTDGANQTVPDAAGTAASLLGANGASLTDLGGMSTDMKAQIKTEVNAAIDDTAIGELSVGVPAKEPTLRTGLMLLYMALRNKLVVQTSGTDALEMYNDAGTLIAKKLLSDDGADYTEAKATSGA